jgi:hypothetical protein
MKQLLYGTTALIGTSLIAASAAQAQEGFEMKLSGFMNAYQGFLSLDEQDGTDHNSFPFYHDSTINFIATQTLDNGVEVGARFELESFGHPADEQWLWFRGDFGSFEMGWTNSAGYRMLQPGPGWAAGVPINTGWVTAFVPAPTTQFTSFRSVSTGTYIDTQNDVYTVSYFSPRFAGFQVGGSFSPFLAGKGTTVGNSANGTTQSFGTSGGGADERSNWHNAWSVGLNYVNSFEGFDVGLSAGYNQAQAPTNGLAGKDQEQYLFGGNVGFAGFTIGGSYSQEVSSLRTDGHAWEVAGAYTMGPSSVNLAYVSTEYKGSVLGDDEHEEWQAIKGAYEYALGPGVDISATIMYAEWTDDSDGPDSDQDGVSLILGTSFTF